MWRTCKATFCYLLAVRQQSSATHDDFLLRNLWIECEDFYSSSEVQISGNGVCSLLLPILKATCVINGFFYANLNFLLFYILFRFVFTRTAFMLRHNRSLKNIELHIKVRNMNRPLRASNHFALTHT